MEINLNGEYIIVNEGQKLAELPVRFQTVILKMMMQQKVDNVLTLGVSHEDITINFEGLIVDLFMMEALDASIGLLMKTERNIINEAGLRDFFDYGNATTWANRIKRLLEKHPEMDPGYTAPQTPNIPIPPPRT